MLSKLTTGVAGLDILTHGGIPEGRATLVVGRSGTGKTILGLQIAAHLAQQGTPTLIVGIEETGDDPDLDFRFPVIRDQLDRHLGL